MKTAMETDKEKSMIKLVLVLVIVAFLVLLTACTNKTKDEGNVVEIDPLTGTNAGEPGPVSITLPCDVAGGFSWVVNGFNSEVHSIDTGTFAPGTPGTATFIVTPVAAGESTLLLAYCEYGRIEGGVKGFTEYKVVVDDANVITLEQNQLHYETQFNPNGVTASSGTDTTGE